AVAGVGRLTVEDELRPEAAADLLVQVCVGEEAVPRAAGPGRKVRRPETLGLRAGAELVDQAPRVVVLAGDRLLVRVDVLLEECAVRRLQRLVVEGLDGHPFSIARMET